MKIHVTQLAEVIEDTLEAIKLGILNSRDQIIAELPQFVDFQVEVVHTWNAEEAGKTTTQTTPAHTIETVEQEPTERKTVTEQGGSNSSDTYYTWDSVV